MTRKEKILEEMRGIGRMAKGKVCAMRRASGKVYHNHQTRVGSRNVVRYVPAEKVESLREATEGYRKFLRLADEYAEAVIRQTKV